MERMIKLVMCGVLFASVPTVVFAQPGNKEDRREEKRERMRREMEIRRTLRISGELGLKESEALRMSELLKAGDEKKRKVKDDLRKEVIDLRRLADGNPSQQEVDSKLKRISELRAEMLKSEEQMLESAAKGLPPGKKAKLAIILGVHEKAARSMMFKQMKQHRMRGTPQTPAVPGVPGAPGDVGDFEDDGEDL